MDPEDYMNAEFEACRDSHGDGGMLLLETLLSTHILMQLISRLVKNSENYTEIGKVLSEYNSQMAIRLAKMAELDQTTVDDICQRAHVMVDYIDALEHSSTSKLH